MLGLNVSNQNSDSKRIKLEVKEEIKDEYDDIYDRYDFSRQTLPNLPILDKSNNILAELDQNNIIIIQGNTGCGKTTQVPQIIIDAAKAKRERCNILVTQPRRLGTVTICQRVCQERNWIKGTVCGYHIGMEPCYNHDTRILYATNAILKEKFIQNPAFINNYTHIILDEIHDREINTDFVLLLMKLSLQSSFSGKLILMSATLDPHILRIYYASESLRSVIPVIRCEMKLHEVKVLYLEDLKNVGINVSEDIKNTTELDEELLDVIGQLLFYLDKIELETERALNSGKFYSKNGITEKRGAVLLFLTGAEQIKKTNAYLSRNLEERLALMILRLYSELPIAEQLRVNEKPPSGKRKIILSTNIAESSITVADVRYVIDLCMTKSLYCEKDTNYTYLKEMWASKSNCEQRKGRAGNSFF